MFKAIIFDMDGVIIDSEPLWEKSEKILLRKFDLEYNPVYREKILGLNQIDSAGLLRDTFNLEITVQEIIDERLKILIDLYRNELNLIDGIEKIISDSKKKNLKVGLASSSPMYVVEFVLEFFDIKKYFNTIVSGDCTTNGKPEPDIYLEAASQLEIDPRDCIAVEDSINGVKAAMKAGMYCIAIPDKRIRTDKYQIADLILRDLSEIILDDII